MSTTAYIRRQNCQFELAEYQMLEVTGSLLISPKDFFGGGYSNFCSDQLLKCTYHFINGFLSLQEWNDHRPGESSQRTETASWIIIIITSWMCGNMHEETNNKQQSWYVHWGLRVFHVHGCLCTSYTRIVPCVLCQNGYQPKTYKQTKIVFGHVHEKHFWQPAKMLMTTFRNTVYSLCKNIG